MQPEGRRGWRVGRLLVAIILILLLLASLFLTFSFLESYLKGAGIVSLISLDWSGYVITSSYLSPQPIVVGVNSSWTVPSVVASSTNQYSAAWIGIGGQSDNTLIQTGTEHDSINGVSVYSAWYEMLPNDSITIKTMTVSPGDVIKASIKLVNSISNTWSIDIRDVTKGQRFQNNFVYNSSRLSAEWIIERPTVGNSLSTLANFEIVTFIDSYATVDASTETILNLPYLPVIMHNRQNNPLVSVSSLDSNGSGFTVSYLRSTSVLEYPVQILESNRGASLSAYAKRRMLSIED